jgi:hypothetical protein
MSNTFTGSGTMTMIRTAIEFLRPGTIRIRRDVTDMELTYGLLWVAGTLTPNLQPSVLRELDHRLDPDFDRSTFGRLIAEIHLTIEREDPAFVALRRCSDPSTRSPSTAA